MGLSASVAGTLSMLGAPSQHAPQQAPPPRLPAGPSHLVHIDTIRSICNSPFPSPASAIMAAKTRVSTPTAVGDLRWCISKLR